MDNFRSSSAPPSNVPGHVHLRSTARRLTRRAATARARAGRSGGGGGRAGAAGRPAVAGRRCSCPCSPRSAWSASRCCRAMSSRWPWAAALPAISVVGVVAGSAYQRRRRAREWAARSAAYRAHLAACVESLTDAASRQRAHAEAVHPAPACCGARGGRWAGLGAPGRQRRPPRGAARDRARCGAPLAAAPGRRSHGRRSSAAASCPRSADDVCRALRRRRRDAGRPRSGAGEADGAAGRSAAACCGRCWCRCREPSSPTGCGCTPWHRPRSWRGCGCCPMPDSSSPIRRRWSTRSTSCA